MRASAVSGIIFLSIMSATAPLSAQDVLQVDRSKTTGLVLGAYLNGSALSVESENSESGRGFSARIGYGFTEMFELFTEINVANIQHASFSDTYVLAHFDLGGRLNFSQSQSVWRPYLDAALAGRAASMDLGLTTLDLRGGGISLGGGTHYFINASLALDAAVKFTFGSFSEGRSGSSDWIDLGSDSFSGTSTRVNLGLAWRP